MSKKQTILIIVILAAAFVAGWSIYTRFLPSGSQQTRDAYPFPKDQNDTVSLNVPKGPGFRQMVRILELSPEQTQKFSEIESQYRTKVVNYTQQLDSIDLAILEEIKKENSDTQKLDSLAARTGEIQHNIKKATTDHFLQIKNLCNPQQREQFNEVISDIDRFRRGKGRGPGNGQRRHVGHGQGRGWRNR